MRPNGLKGPMRMPAMRNPRIIGCLKMYASAPTAEQTKRRYPRLPTSSIPTVN